MCQYCGCRDIETVALLTDDHVEIQNRCGDSFRAIESGDYAKAAQLARELDAIMRIHNAVEEKALYLSIGAHEEFAEQTGQLFDEHDALDEVLADIIAHDDAGRLDDVDWAKVLAAYDVLFEHIQAEENGLFPAAAIVFEPEEWDRCERMRAEAEAKEPIACRHCRYGHRTDRAHSHE